jgi:hypothetical protein
MAANEPQGRTNFGPAAQTDLTVDMEEVELGAVVSLDRFETTAQAISDAGGDRSST